MSFMMKTENGYIPISGNNGSSASEISYDNTESVLEAENVQEALDEIVETKADKTEILHTYTLAEYEEIKDTIPVGTTFAISDDVDDIEKYVPVPQVAEVGQVLAVKAVDEEGRPTEWECVKGSSGDNSPWMWFEIDDNHYITFTNDLSWGEQVHFPCIGDIVVIDPDTNAGTYKSVFAAKLLNNQGMKSMFLFHFTSSSSYRFESTSLGASTKLSNTRCIIGLPKDVVSKYNVEQH